MTIRSRILARLGFPAPGELERLAAENQTLRDHAAGIISDRTMMTGLNLNESGLYMGMRGGAAGLLVESLADQFKGSGATNYVEISFESREATPGVSYIVTIQRVLGATPAQKLAVERKRVLRLEGERGVLRRLLTEADGVIEAAGLDGSPDVDTLRDAIAKALLPDDSRAADLVGNGTT